MTNCLARSVPIVAAPTMQQQPAAPPPYSASRPAPIGWAINEASNEHPASGKQTEGS